MANDVIIIVKEKECITCGKSPCRCASYRERRNLRHQGQEVYPRQEGLCNCAKVHYNGNPPFLITNKMVEKNGMLVRE